MPKPICFRLGSMSAREAVEMFKSDVLDDITRMIEEHRLAQSGMAGPSSRPLDTASVIEYLHRIKIVD